MGSDVLNIPCGWDCKSLVDCTLSKNISYGIVQPGQHDENGIGIIRVNNFENGELNTKDVLKVSPSIESKFMKTRLTGGELLLTLVGSTGQTAIVPKELIGWNVPRAVAVIRPSKDITAEWLNICLQSPYTKHFLDVRANTTVQKTLNLKDVKDIPIPLPPIEERNKLESIVVNITSKITLNRQINKTLEQMAQTLFKSWFVDFDPVVDNALDAGFFEQDLGFSEELLHRVEVRKAVRKSDNFKPLAEDIRQLFPNAFEECAEPALGLGGWVPSGWELGNLSDVTNILSGFAFKSNEFQNSGFGVIKIKNIGNDKSVDICDIQRIDISLAEKAKRFSLKDGDLLMAMTGATVGKFGFLVTENQEPYYLNQRVAKFEAIDESTAYLYCILNRKITESYIVNTAQGSAQPNISAKDILAMPLITAPQSIRELFNDKVNDSFQKIIQMRKQNIILEHLRDTLLPKLISGELSLSDIKIDIPEETLI
ncbi:restriction endonuclease subunit S [Proteus mirabilis]|uniref:restriction endonuclease subunit S n=1 Tax=Proteus mirabilis TaxID=584 RepID=UPI001A331EAE|nr:restriction endonuclease subunit S [Proteus mirabilis]EKU4145041.1 restriction endonuclease subunit S [Proteus mirabilis]MBI6255675.1 restriction endonuclease subunit S [Proteus mirabilis]MDH7533127.1 restriction endonuclease subunit S [Proteus mirabilis]MDM3629434.1 restriction endonuclease subunit S [Proteus mirabilis]MDM3640044.1 restriction endonuclease subunit S [Proteus mirabilis]